MQAPSIHPHPNFTTLVEGLVEAIGSVHGLDTVLTGLKPIQVIVPSLQFTDWLQVAIAKRQGLCMGLEFMMPQAFIERALALSNDRDKRRENPWSRRNLTWRLLPHIKDYAEQLGVTNPSSRDRLALAGLLADQFDQYGHFRPEIILKWNQAKPASKNSWTNTDKENEAWQRKLWRQVQSEIQSSETPQPHPALLLDKLAGSEDFLRSLKEAFPRLFVVGSGALDPLLVRLLHMLGTASGDVQVHLALPSVGYLGELRSSPPVRAQDPEELQMPEGHPLLVSMGRHAVGSFLLLGELDENYTHWPETHTPADAALPSSLLGCLQADIRQLREPSRSYTGPDHDCSLRVHSCYGPRREMEVLRDELLRAFSEIKDLKPEEVIVATASLETYAPLVAAVLDQSPAIPVRLTELPPSEQDSMAEGLLALLDMAGGNQEASALLELLHLRAVRDCLGIADDSAGLERLRDWVYQSGLTRGLGDGENPSAPATGSWRFARDRMIAGKWFGPEVGAQYPKQDYVLPVAGDLGGDLDLKEAFLQWHWQLSITLRQWSSEASPAEWSRRLSEACDQLLSSPGDEDSRLEVQYALNYLAQLDCTEPVEAAAVFDWLQAESAESGRRTSVSGRITFGRFKQLQNIPCRVLAMVGMQDGAFPRQNRLPAWDLLHLDPRAWDRNARIDDRQLFLDAVLNPTDRLIITASTRNVRSGKSEPFSACVDELMRVTQATSREKVKLVVEHRLQPFAAGYFRPGQEESLPPSFDSNSLRVAQSFLNDGTQPMTRAPFWDPDSAGRGQRTQEKLEISVEQLIGFWKDPAKAFLRALGIALGFEEGDDAALDRTPLSLDGLQKWAVKAAIVQGIAEDAPSLAYTKAQMQADRGLPDAELGNLTWNSLQMIAEPLGRKIREMKTDPLFVDLSVNVTNQAVRITGNILRGTAEGDMGLLAWRAGKFKDAKDYLPVWIHAIVAACAGESLQTYILDEEDPASPEVLKTYDLQEAGALLGHLLEGFVQGQSCPLCYGPKTSDAYANAVEEWGDSPDETAFEVASDEWNREATKYNSSAGEGFSPAAQIAWRDQDPFAHQQAWHQWARNIARTLRAWFKPEHPSET